MNYYNFIPNMGNMNYQTQPKYEQQNYQTKTTNLYDPYQGFIRGNMFKDLYDPYKLNNPYNIEPANDQAKMLTSIDALGFAMTDLNLYLDIYPNSKEHIDLFNRYRIEKNNLVREYENRYGPLTLDSDANNTYPWAWEKAPWPWEN